MASFDLIEQPWIPCIMPDGRRVELRLRETLAKAHEIAELRDESPLVTVALHRLLLAILHRNFGPENLTEWKQLWDGGRFDSGTLDVYFGKWRDRFDLFSEKHPFYQTATLETDDPLPAATLFDELASNNNATLFDHTHNEPPLALTYAAAARGLVYRQAFALGLGVSPAATISGVRTKTGNRQDGSLARGLIVLMRGKSLFGTLMRNLVRYRRDGDDAPIWERETAEALVAKTSVLGQLDLYTAQARRLRLIRDDSDGTVSAVHFVQGRKIADTLDPMKPYVRSDDDWVLLGLSHERAIWRDSASLFEIAHRDERPIAALTWMRRLVDEEPHRTATLCMDVFGAATQPGRATSLLMFRHEQLPLPTGVLQDVRHIEAIRIALGLAEQMQGKLRGSVWKVCWDVLKAEERDPKKENVDRMLQGMAPERGYWPVLERPFRELVLALAESASDTQRTIAPWVLTSVAPAARDAFEGSAGRLDGSARLLRAVARGRDTLHKELNIVCKQWKEKQNEQLVG